MASLNPANWFNDLSDFAVSIEEMSPRKNDTYDRSTSDATEPTSSVSTRHEEVLIIGKTTAVAV